MENKVPSPLKFSAGQGFWAHLERTRKFELINLIRGDRIILVCVPLLQEPSYSIWCIAIRGETMIEVASHGLPTDLHHPITCLPVPPIDPFIATCYKCPFCTRTSGGGSCVSPGARAQTPTRPSSNTPFSGLRWKRVRNSGGWIRMFAALACSQGGWTIGCPTRNAKA